MNKEKGNFFLRSNEVNHISKEDYTKVEVLVNAVKAFLTSSLRTPKIFIKEFSYFLMPCHQHCLGVNLLVQR